MSTLYVTEFKASLALPAAGGPLPAGDVGDITDQTPVSFTGTAGASAAFDDGTQFVRIHTDGDCHVAWGASPTATTNNMKMIAGQTEYFAVPKGQSFKVSAIDA